jgi:hypothetical protein
LLDFEADHDLDRVRRALGIGHSGFGEIAWPTVRTYEAVPGSAMLLACGWLTIAVCAALGQPWLGLTLGLLVAPLTGIALLVSAILGSDPGPRVALTAYGVLLAEPPDRLTCVPYEEVTDVRVDPQGMTVATRSTPFVIRMRAALAEEREHLAAQILSAARRSRGDGPPRPGLPASLAVLAPRGEATRVWLERIDAAAASLASLGAYRRSELNAQDLFGALESPDAPAPMRAAAARVLARVVPEEAKTRVAQVLATEHDAYARACIRIALEEDVDVAARELERLESA